MPEIIYIFKITEEWKKYKGSFTLGNFMNAMGSETSKELIIKWKIDENYTFTSFIPKRDKQMIFYEEGFGQRDHKNSDFGVTVPNFYIFRNETNETSTFVNVFEGNYENQEIVKNVEIIESNNGNVVIQIKTSEGNDFILSSFNGDVINGYSRSTDARLAVDVESDPDSIVMFDGGFFQFPRGKMNSKSKNLNGKVNGHFNSKSESWFEIFNESLKLSDLKKCQSIYVTGDDMIERAYPILKVEQNGKNFNVLTRVNSEGLRTHPTNFWRMTSVADKDDVHHNGKSKSGLSSGAIAAIVIVVILVVAGAAVGGFFLYKRYKNNGGSLVNSSLFF